MMRRSTLPRSPTLLLGALIALLLPAALTAQADTLRVEGDVPLHYELSGEGPPVVLLHGWTHDARVWRQVVPALERRFTVLRPDRRGWGRSGGHADVSRDPGDLDSLMSALGWSDAHVVGHSQGADAALRFAVAHPERIRSLVLYGSPQPAGFDLPWTGPDALPPPPEMARIVREHGIDSLGAVIFASPLADGFEPGSEGAELAGELWTANAERAFADPRPPSGATPRPSVDDLGAIAAPTLVLTGELEMPFFQLVADALAFGIPGAERVVVEGGGHAVHMQEPERWTAEIVRFLRAVKGR